MGGKKKVEGGGEGLVEEGILLAQGRMTNES